MEVATKEGKMADERLGLRGLRGEEEVLAADLLRAVEKSSELTMPAFMGMVKRGRIPRRKKAKPIKRIVVVGRYRILFIRKGRLGRTKVFCNILLYTYYIIYI